MVVVVVVVVVVVAVSVCVHFREVLKDGWLAGWLTGLLFHTTSICWTE